MEARNDKNSIMSKFIYNLAIDYENAKPILYNGNYVGPIDKPSSDLKMLFKNYVNIILEKLTKRVVKNIFFKKFLYNRFILPHLNLNAIYCQNNVVNHITMEPIMDSFQTGFEKYKNSLICKNYEHYLNKKLKKIDEYEFNRPFDKIVYNMNIDINIEEIPIQDKDREVVKKYLFEVALQKIYTDVIIDIIKNHKKYKNLSILVNDYEMFFTRNMRNLFLQHDYLNDIFNKANSAFSSLNLDTPVVAEMDKIKDLFINFNKNVSKFNPLSTPLSTKENEYNISETDAQKYETLKCWKNLCKSVLDVMEEQKINVFNYDSLDSVKDWFKSNLNFVFSKKYIDFIYNVE